MVSPFISFNRTGSSEENGENLKSVQVTNLVGLDIFQERIYLDFTQGTWDVYWGLHHDTNLNYINLNYKEGSLLGSWQTSVHNTVSTVFFVGVGIKERRRLHRRYRFVLGGVWTRLIVSSLTLRREELDPKKKKKILPEPILTDKVSSIMWRLNYQFEEYRKNTPDNWVQRRRFI